MSEESGIKVWIHPPSGEGGELAKQEQRLEEAEKVIHIALGSILPHPPNSNGGLTLDAARAYAKKYNLKLCCDDEEK